MKAIVVEDSRIAREGLMSMLASYSDIELIGGADHPDTALALLKNNRADVLFLDIHMPGSSGFDLLEQLNYSPLVIFTTAYSEHAIRSFDFNTVDYLLKPINPERLAQAINKLRLYFSSSRASSLLEQEYLTQNLDINTRMFIRGKEKCHLIDLATVRYFENCKNYARLFFNDDNAFIKSSLNSLEKSLPVKYFFRTNRQYIVNLNQIKSIKESRSDGYCVVLNDGKEIGISRRHLSRLEELLSF